ncbi:MAG: NifU family SUF system FeS assembly protein, nitrogen fixation protein NifU [Nitrosopumilales archaeon]|nr:MAG: NifU family SUF system FeS assembly protein, nitrogen fixation protein NifU [Nitrosopumilales archaeon]
MSDPIYTEIIIDEGKNPQNKGTIENPDISQHDSNPMCGDSITLQMNVKDDSISDVKWDGEGCTICKACTSVLTQMVKGKTVDYAKDLKKEEILSELGLEYLVDQSPVRIKCALLSLKVLKFGLYSFLAKKLKDSSSFDNLKEEAAKLY